jgi:uncharacterized repeat protein (TIGR03803 family)
MNIRKISCYLTVALALAGFSALAQAQYTGLYTFNGNYDGSYPYYADLLAQGPDGNLHGTMPVGSIYARGSEFDYTINGGVSIHPLTASQPYNPYAGLTLGVDGNYYGASIHSTASNSPGMLFKISTNAAGANGTPGVVTPIYYFTGGADGTSPYAPPIQGPDGNLYGVTYDPGASGHIYQIIMPPPGSTTTLGTLGWHYALPSLSRAPLILANDGNLYGTYAYGGMTINGVAPNNASGGGIFQVTLSGTLSGVYNINPFDPNTNVNGGKGDGCNPWGPVMQAADGNLYGTASGCGAYSGGVVYKVGLNGAGFAVIHNFQTADGTAPSGGLVQGSDGYLYGLASANGGLTQVYLPGGGPLFKSGGTLFKTDTSGANFVRLYTLYKNNVTNQGSGISPFATPTLHTSGAFYGITEYGGAGSTTTNYYGTYDNGGELFSFGTGMQPFVSIVNLRSAHVGDRVSIIGQGFLSATGVTFGGISVSWTKQALTIWSDNYMTVTVPSGAKTGTVVVQELNKSLSTPYPFTIACSGISCVHIP